LNIARAEIVFRVEVRARIFQRRLVAWARSCMAYELPGETKNEGIPKTRVAVMDAPRAGCLRLSCSTAILARPSARDLRCFATCMGLLDEGMLDLTNYAKLGCPDLQNRFAATDLVLHF
jgi:hypothetical protein